MKNSEYVQILKSKADNYVHRVYALTRQFPKDELYGVTSQLRRAALSVVLNVVEGYARNRRGCDDRSYEYFLEVSYGSLQESKYLLNFSKVEKYLSEKEYAEVMGIAEEIGAMLWSAIKKLK